MKLKVTWLIALLCAGQSVQAWSLVELANNKYKLSLAALGLGITYWLGCKIYQNYYRDKVKQLQFINPFFKNTDTINTIVKIMDGIENKKLGYPDYSGRTGLIWSDGWIQTTEKKLTFEECKDTPKITEVNGELKQHVPESIVNYSDIYSIVLSQIIPKSFKAIQKWASIPKKVFTQIFFQRCSTSDSMDWHQDPGEDGYDEMADYTLVLMLGKKDDLKHGWSGGEFKIRAGLPRDTYDEKDVKTIEHEYNQGVLFNNKLNSHGVNAVATKLKEAKRDLIVVLFYLQNRIPLKK